MQPGAGPVRGTGGWRAYRRHESCHQLDPHRPGNDPDKGGGKVKRLFRVIWAIVSSRALPPVIIGFFLVVYIGIAFFTDETLTVLMAVTRGNFFLAAVL